MPTAREVLRDAAQAARPLMPAAHVETIVATQLAAMSSAGLAVVPMEPTAETVDQGLRAYRTAPTSSYTLAMAAAYRAMVRPSAPKETQG